MIVQKGALTAKLSEIEWHRVVLLLLFASGLISTALALEILKGKGNNTSGIFTLAIANTEKRALPSIPDVSVTTVLSQVETALPDFPSSVISQVETAVGSVATAVSGIVPQNITLGTKQLCVVFPHSTDCQDIPVSLPVSLSSILDSTALRALDRAFALCDPRTMEVLLVMGSVLCFAVMGVSLVLCFNSSLNTVVQRGRYLLLFLTLAVFVLFLVPTVVWSKVESVVSKAVVALSKGSVPRNSIVMAVCAASNTIFSILYLLIIHKSGFL